MKRPVGVTLLALFELSKAGFLLVVMAILSLRPESLSGSGPALRLLISIATNHIATASSDLSGRSPDVTVLFPLYAVFCAVFGCGVWFMKKWARTTLMWSSGIYLIRYAQALLFRDFALREPTILADPTFTAFAMVDAIILMWLYSAKEAFGVTGRRA